jgi:hypothetical protein
MTLVSVNEKTFNISYNGPSHLIPIFKTQMDLVRTSTQLRQVLDQWRPHLLIARRQNPLPPNWEHRPLEISTDNCDDMYVAAILSDFSTNISWLTMTLYAIPLLFPPKSLWMSALHMTFFILHTTIPRRVNLLWLHLPPVLLPPLVHSPPSRTTRSRRRGGAFRPM